MHYRFGCVIKARQIITNKPEKQSSWQRQRNRPDWWIFRELAKRFGQEWASDSARKIWDDGIWVLAPQLRGIKYARLEGDGLQWPCPDESHEGACVLHRDGPFTCGLGIFTPVDWTAPAEVSCAEYPLVLSTGRRLVHYHTRTQTGRCEGLNDLLGEETADVALADAQALNIAHGEMIKVVSRRGEVLVKAGLSKNSLLALNSFPEKWLSIF